MPNILRGLKDCRGTGFDGVQNFSSNEHSELCGRVRCARSIFAIGINVCIYARELVSSKK